MVITRVCGTRSTGSIPVGHPFAGVFSFLIHMPNVLILTAAMGGGHNAAARALAEASSHYKDLSVLVLDVNDAAGKTGKKLLVSSYHVLAGKLPRVWKFLYKNTNNALAQNIFANISAVLSGISAKQIIEQAKKFKPDYILGTHFFAPYFLSKTPLAKIPWGMVVTDYAWHEMWYHPMIHNHFVANKMIKNKSKTFQRNSAHFSITGIPVNPEFYITKNPETLREKYSIPLDQPCILLLSGGDGFTHVADSIPYFKKIKKPITIIAIAGKNVGLEQKFEKQPWPKDSIHQVVGWTNTMDEYMRMADIIVSKPGGLTVSECQALGKYMIMVSPIPGQEEANAQYVESHDFGKIAQDNNEVIDLINQFLENPKKLMTKKNLPATDAIWQTIIKELQQKSS